MMGKLVDKARQKANGLGLEVLAPRCDGEQCPGSHARWHGLLRRLEGLRFEGNWYCGPECFRRALEFRVQHLFTEPRVTGHSRTHRMPLGLVLLSRGVIRHDQLQSALQHQRATGRLFGECLCHLGFANEDQIVAAIASQWGCPVYLAERSSECDHLIPRLLQQEHLMLPIHWVPTTRDLYVAFARSVNHTVLYSIERMLECHTIPCFIKESEVVSRLSSTISDSQDSEIAIETSVSVQEISGSAVSYAQQTGAEEVRLLGCGPHLWIRLQGHHSRFDLLFRRSRS